MTDPSSKLDKLGVRRTPRPKTPRPKASEQPVVVGVGASAGGLDAIKEFFDHMPPDTGAAFAVVQHLSPDFRSLMDEILVRHTEMQIVRVDADTEVEPNKIYLIPARNEMVLTDSGLKVRTKQQDRSPPLVIDVLFRSLAETQGEWAIGVVLSGSGSDGTQGVRAIAQAGGVVALQSPSSAQFESMPRSARTAVDDALVGRPERLSESIANFLLSGDRAAIAGDDADRAGVDLDPREYIFATLRKHTRIDFSHYRPAMIERRVVRRLAMVPAATLADYAEMVAASEAERKQLILDLLIGVTEFFRDGEAFHRLQNEVLHRTFAEKRDGDPVRIWVLGCATGEEAISVAIAADEVAQRLDKQLQFRIFATDVHADAIRRAARCRFPLDIATQVGRERFDKYFVVESGMCTIRSSLRERLVFAQHDVLRDAPFRDMDLVTCRNMLIYLKPKAQQHALELMLHSLRLGGVLFLGPSETVGELGPYFDTVDSRWRIFTKRANRTAPRRLASTWEPRRSVVAHGPKTTRSTSTLGDEQMGTLLLEAVMGRQGECSVLIGANRQLLYTFGDSTPFFEPLTGNFEPSIEKMLKAELQTAASALLHRLERDTSSYPRTSVRIGSNGQAVEMWACAISPREQAVHMLVCLKRVTTTPKTDGSEETRELPHHRVMELEQALLETSTELQNTVEELETSNEELQSTNEELIASNEELQSTNEELQSVNEELYTVNAEHQLRIEELIELNADIENLFRSTQVGVLFLDERLHIRRYTPELQEQIKLIPGDVGRPFTQINHGIQDADLVNVARTVMISRTHAQHEVRSRDGTHLLLRAFPYVTADDGIRGAVLTLVDIEAVYQARSELAVAQSIAEDGERRAQALLQAIPDIILRVRTNGTILNYHSPPGDRVRPDAEQSKNNRVTGHSLSDLNISTKAWAVLQEAVHVAVSTGEAQTRRFRVDSGESFSWHEIRAVQSDVDEAVCIVRDISEQKGVESQLRELTTELETQVNHDYLTELTNRRGAERFLLKEIGTGPAGEDTLSVVLLDCDDFKVINDQLGHATGDVVLKEVAVRIRAQLRPQDCIARIGGDEFLALLPRTRIEGAHSVAERMRLAVMGTPLVADGKQLTLTVSCGVAEVATGTVALHEVIAQVQRRLAMSKRRGKNLVSSDDPNTASSSRPPRRSEPPPVMHILEGTGLRIAPQPIMDLDSGSQAAVELLSRGPVGEFESPMRFLRECARHNALALADLNCIRACMAWMRSHPSKGRVHVNILPSTLLETPKESLLELFGDQVSRLALEISEMQVLGNPAHLLPPLDVLRKAGAQIAMDDVGCGTSSLESLTTLNPEIMKLDRSAITSAHADVEKRERLARLVAVGRALGTMMIAEGIEDTADLNLVRDLGIEFGQGFLWGRPVVVP